MIDIDKVINEFNDTTLEDKLNKEMTKEQLRKEFQSKLHEGEDTKEESSADYFKVIKDGEDNITLDGSTITTTYTTLNSDELISYDFPTRTSCIKEADQVRKIKIKREDLERILNSEDEEVELKVYIEGRDCLYSGHPINEDF